MDKNASCNLRSGVTVTRKNRRTSKFGVETNSTIGAVLQENLTKDIKNPDGLNIFKHFLFFFFSIRVFIKFPSKCEHVQTEGGECHINEC